MREVKKVYCEKCNKLISLSNYSKHLRRHEIHPETFINISDINMVCKFCGKECINLNSFKNHERLCKQNPDRNYVSHTLGKNGHTAWNKGLTKENCEILKNTSDKVKQGYLEGKYAKLLGKDNPMSRKDVREKVSKTIMEKSKQGLWHTSLAKNMHINYKGIDLHSKWELGYAIYLDQNNISWQRCSDRFSYIYQGKLRYYTPDFYLPDTNTYIEVKGYIRSKDYAKWEQFPKDKTLKILFNKDLKDLGILDKNCSLLVDWPLA